MLLFPLKQSQLVTITIPALPMYMTKKRSIIEAEFYYWFIEYGTRDIEMDKQTCNIDGCQ